MTDLCAQAIENMECQQEPVRGVGRGRARVSRGLGGGTPPLRRSRPEKLAQALENAQNRLGSGGRPKPRPGRSSCRLCSTRNAGWAWRRAREGARLARLGRRDAAPPTEPPGKLAQPFEKAQNRLGSCGRPKPRPGSIALSSLVSSKRRLGRGRRVWEDARLARLGRREAAPPTEPPGKAGATL